MKRSKLWNVYRRSKCPYDLVAYRVQRNLVSKLNKLAKLNYFKRAVDSLQESGKSFWKLCKPYFSNINSGTNDFCFNHEGQTIQNDTEIANVFNVFF